MDTIEEFFQSRGADVFHEVCPIADPSVFTLFNERGYRPVEFSNVLYRPINPDLRLSASRNEAVKVRVIEEDEVELWAQTASRVGASLLKLRISCASWPRSRHTRSRSRLSQSWTGRPIATGALTIAGDVALLAGASTIPTARRQGAQLALLEERLRYAAAQGCTVAMMVAQPGSGSQRNAERHGFRIAYTRTKWQLESRIIRWTITMQDFEKLGAFYLGRPYDLGRKPKDGLLLYDSKDLVTHAVCVGMTGSGKTGLCISLLEEAAIDGIPAIIIDPKGDLSNLLLTFPNLTPQDFEPWVNEGDAQKKVFQSPIRRTAGRALERRTGEVGPGRRTHQTTARCGRLSHLHARQQCRHCQFRFSNRSPRRLKQSDKTTSYSPNESTRPSPACSD